MRHTYLRVLALLIALTLTTCRPPAELNDRRTPNPAVEPDEVALAEDVRPPPKADPNLTGRVGLIVVTNSRTWPRLLNSPRDEGVVILFVQPDGPSDGSGLKPGDVITSVDDEPTTNAELAVRQLRARPDQDRRLRVVPAGSGEARTITVTARRPGNIDLRNDHFTPAIENDPEDPVARYLRAQSGGPFDEALEDSERATEIFPGFTEAISLRAELLWNQSRQNEALDDEVVDQYRTRARTDWRIALELDEQNTRVKVSYSQALTQDGSPRPAKTQAEDAIQADKLFPGAHYALATAEFTLGRPGAAARPARQAIELNPFDVRYYQLLAGIFMRLDRRADAQETVEAIINLVEDTQTREKLNNVVRGR